MLGALLVVALGGLLASWYATATFTVTRSVIIQPPGILEPPDLAQRPPERREMRIECRALGGYYVSESGADLFWNVATGSPEDPGPFCEEARSERQRAAVAFMLLGLLIGGGIIATGLVQQRREERSRLAPPAETPVGTG